MATFAPPKPIRPIGSDSGGDPPPPGGEGQGDGPPPGRPIMPEKRYYTGMMLAMGGMTMFFVGFVSAYIVRRGLSDDWVPLQLPPVLFAGTVILLASSFTVEKARRSFARVAEFRRWWFATTGLGVIFLICQLTGWRQLAQAGIYLNTNPSSSFFYVLTSAHALHLLGGLLALLFFSGRLLMGRITRTQVGVTSLYWHFLDGLWVFLLLLLLIWR